MGDRRLYPASGRRRYGGREAPTRDTSMRRRSWNSYCITGSIPIPASSSDCRPEDPTQFTTKEEFIEAVKKQMAYFYEQIRDGYNIIVPHHMLRLPVMFASLVMEGCVQNGRSVQEGGTKYNSSGMFITGPANLADSIVAIEEVVFKDKTLTMEKLIRILDTNFEGEERIRQLMINKPPKFGNDNEYVDGVARDLLNFVANTVQQYKDSRGGHYSFCNLSQTVNISHGEVCGATADGRFACHTLSDNSSPVMGRDLSGPTATVKSVRSPGSGTFQRWRSVQPAV